MMIILIRVEKRVPKGIISTLDQTHKIHHQEVDQENEDIDQGLDLDQDQDLIKKVDMIKMISMTNMINTTNTTNITSMTNIIKRIKKIDLEVTKSMIKLKLHALYLFQI